MKSLAERRRASARIGARHYTVARHRDTLMKEEIANRLPPDGVFVDAGCGAAFFLARQFRNSCRLALGVDLLPMDVRKHALPGVLSDLAALGVASGAVDVLAMRSVVEHLPDPEAVFREVERVLKPGGAVVMLCPNKWYYASVAGRLIPGRATAPILRLIFGSSVYDNFPTYYRANTRRAVRRLAGRTGLECEVAIVTEHPPDYLKIFPFLYRLGMLFEQLTVRWKPLHWMATSFIFVLRKPHPSAAGAEGGGDAGCHRGRASGGSPGSEGRADGA